MGIGPDIHAAAGPGPSMPVEGSAPAAGGAAPSGAGNLANLAALGAGMSAAAGPMAAFVANAGLDAVSLPGDEVPTDAVATATAFGSIQGDAKGGGDGDNQNPDEEPAATVSTSSTDAVRSASRQESTPIEKQFTSLATACAIAIQSGSPTEGIQKSMSDALKAAEPNKDPAAIDNLAASMVSYISVAVGRSPQGDAVAAPQAHANVSMATPQAHVAATPPAANAETSSTGPAYSFGQVQASAAGRSSEFFTDAMEALQNALKSNTMMESQASQMSAAAAQSAASQSKAAADNEANALDSQGASAITTGAISIGGAAVSMGAGAYSSRTASNAASEAKTTELAPTNKSLTNYNDKGVANPPDPVSTNKPAAPPESSGEGIEMKTMGTKSDSAEAPTSNSTLNRDSSGSSTNENLDATPGPVTDSSTTTTPPTALKTEASETTPTGDTATPPVASRSDTQKAEISQLHENGCVTRQPGESQPAYETRNDAAIGRMTPNERVALKANVEKMPSEAGSAASAKAREAFVPKSQMINMVTSGISSIASAPFSMAQATMKRDAGAESAAAQLFQNAAQVDNGVFGSAQQAVSGLVQALTSLQQAEQGLQQRNQG